MLVLGCAAAVKTPTMFAVSQIPNSWKLWLFFKPERDREDRLKNLQSEDSKHEMPNYLKRLMDQLAFSAVAVFGKDSTNKILQKQY